jgi:pimeloyl-ACP methyl ester carboxylesterase
MASIVSLVRQEKHGHNFLIARPRVLQKTEPIIFIHGMSGFAGYMVEVMSYFAKQGYCALAPDIIGHGERAHIDLRGKSVYHYIDDVGNFLDRVVLPEYGSRMILVGHSMGGVVAAKLAERRDVASSVLITPAPPRGVVYLPGSLIRFTFSDALQAFGSAFMSRPFVPSRQLIESLFVDPEKSRHVIDLWSNRRIANESFLAALELGLSQISVDKENVVGPMLVVGALRDVVIHSSVSTRIAEYFDADHVMLNELGHMCPFEWGWEKTAHVVEDWLRKKA